MVRRASSSANPWWVGGVVVLVVAAMVGGCPASFNSLNIQKGQRYFFKVEVGEKGILRVQDIRKV